MPFPFSYFDPSKNTFIVGASGWGKTNLINLLQENCLKKNQAVIFIDPKGSAESIKYFKKLCMHYERKYYIFSEFDQEASSFNPIMDMTNSQRVSSIMRSFDWGENTLRNLLSDIMLKLLPRAKRIFIQFAFHYISKGFL
jgi:ABC-type branched-subunit amino acid transport system ATPase component